MSPKPGKPSEALLGGPLDGLRVRKTKEQSIYMTKDNFWFSIYSRDSQNKLRYIADVSPLILHQSNPNQQIRGM